MISVVIELKINRLNTIKLFIFLILSSTIGCKKNCSKIDNVSKFSFTYIDGVINTPINLKSLVTDNDFNHIVTDSLKCNELHSLIKQLEVQDNISYQENSYLCLKIYSSSGIVYLYYNNFNIQIDNSCVYKKDKSLLNFLKGIKHNETL